MRTEIYIIIGITICIVVLFFGLKEFLNVIQFFKIKYYQKLLFNDLTKKIEGRYHLALYYLINAILYKQAEIETNSKFHKFKYLEQHLINLLHCELTFDDSFLDKVSLDSYRFIKNDTIHSIDKKQIILLFNEYDSFILKNNEESKI